MNSKDILYLIARQITDLRTWQSFSLVNKITMKICQDMWVDKKYELSDKFVKTLPSGPNYPFDTMIIYNLPYIKGKAEKWCWRIETIKDKCKTIKEYKEDGTLLFENIYFNNVEVLIKN